MQRVEIGDAIDAEYHGLAVDHKLTGAVFQGGLTDPAAAGDQPHAVASRSTRMRKPSCLISWNHSGPAGTLFLLVGRQNSNALDIRTK